MNVSSLSLAPLSLLVRRRAREREDMGAKSRKRSSHAVTRRKSSHVSSLAPDKQTCEVRRIRIDPRDFGVAYRERNDSFE